MFCFETMGLVGVKVNGVDEQSDGNTVCGTLAGQVDRHGSQGVHLDFICHLQFSFATT